jgi:hypothetical protein
VIGRDYFMRQATILLKFAKTTTHPKVAAGLIEIEKAADLNCESMNRERGPIRRL